MIIQAFCISMMVLFLHACSWDGAIFEGIKKLINSEKKIAKPIYSCPICMTPWWGTIAFFILFWDSELMDWKWYATVIATASGISVINVIGLYIKEYCEKRTPDADKCC